MSELEKLEQAEAEARASRDKLSAALDAAQKTLDDLTAEYVKAHDAHWQAYSLLHAHRIQRPVGHRTFTLVNDRIRGAKVGDVLRFRRPRDEPADYYRVVRVISDTCAEFEDCGEGYAAW